MRFNTANLLSLTFIISISLGVAKLTSNGNIPALIFISYITLIVTSTVMGEFFKRLGK